MDFFVENGLMKAIKDIKSIQDIGKWNIID